MGVIYQSDARDGVYHKSGAIVVPADNLQTVISDVEEIRRDHDRVYVGPRTSALSEISIDLGFKVVVGSHVKSVDFAGSAHYLFIEESDCLSVGRIGKVLVPNALRTGHWKGFGVSNVADGLIS
jgi:hypothetical protein